MVPPVDIYRMRETARQEVHRRTVVDRPDLSDGKRAGVVGRMAVKVTAVVSRGPNSDDAMIQ